MLERKVRKSLMEVKEQKERNLIKENLVKARLSVLAESIKSKGDFNLLSENKQIQISFNVIQELSYLESSGLLSEADLGGALNSIFGGFFGNATQTFFEPIIKKFIVPLFGEGFMTNFIVSYLTTRPSEVIKSFSDCQILTKLISESIVEAMFMSLQRQKGWDGAGYGFIRNTLGGAIKGTDFAQGIEKGISSTVCSLFDKFADNAEKVKSNLATN
jgi:hypothetical protein